MTTLPPPLEQPEDDSRKKAVLALRHLAFLLDTHPELPTEYQRYSFEKKFHIRLASYRTLAEGEVLREQMANIARALRKSYFKVDKDMSTNEFKLTVPLRDSGWTLEVSCPKEEVCEKRVIGHRIVEEPEYEEVKIGYREVEKEIVEWDCSEPLLSGARS